MRGRIRIEIEHHDENSFHTTYKVERYTEYAQEVERKLRRHLEEKDITLTLATNPGPPKGCAPFWNCKGWYTTTKGEKVRYPRLGSFEVFVVVQKDFAPNNKLPEIMQVWSKLQSRKWPDPERLAASVADLLSAAQDGQEVQHELQELRGRVSQRPKVQPAATSIHPPMFFGLTPRGGTPTPVEVRVPEDRSRSISPRPSSAAPALEQRLPRAASPQRPSSAKQMRSLDSTPPASHQASTIDTQRPPEPLKALDNLPRDDDGATRAGDSAPPSFRPDVTGEVGTANETTTTHTARDPWDDFEDGEAEETQPHTAPPAPIGPSAALPVPAATPFSPSPSSAGSATPSNKKHLQELGNRLVSKYGSSAKPADLLKRPGQVWAPEALLAESEFKSNLYHLGVFSDPYGAFNFAGLFKEMAEGTDRASLQSLIDGLQAFFEVDVGTSGRQSPMLENYGEDEFEEEDLPTPAPATAAAPAPVAVTPAPVAVTPAPVAAPVAQPPAATPDASSEYGEDDFEEEEPAARAAQPASPAAVPTASPAVAKATPAPAPVHAPAPAPKPAAAPAPVVQPKDVSSDYGEDDFEDEDPAAAVAAAAPAFAPPATPQQPPEPAKQAMVAQPKDVESRMDSEDVSNPFEEDERMSMASPSRSASEQGGAGGVKHYETDDFDEVASEEDDDDIEPPRPVSPPKPAGPPSMAMPPSGPPSMAMPPSMPPEFGMGMDYEETFEVQSEAESVSDEPLFADKVSEGSGQHDYAENFDNFSDGIEEVPEVDSDGDDMLS